MFLLIFLLRLLFIPLRIVLWALFFTLKLAKILLVIVFFAILALFTTGAKFSIFTIFG